MSLATYPSTNIVCKYLNKDRQELERFLNSLKSGLRSRYLSILKYPSITRMLLDQDQFLNLKEIYNKDISEKDLKKYSKFVSSNNFKDPFFLKKENLLCYFIFCKNKSLNERVENFKILNRYLKKDEYILDYLICTRISNVDLDDLLKDFFKNKEKIINEKIVEPLILSKDLDNIEELITKKQLIEEGKRMNHCVGNFDNVIKDGHSRIFSINKTSTLQIGYSSQGWEILQHYTFKNNNPSFSDEQLAFKLMFYLNDNYHEDNPSVKCIDTLDF